MTDIKDGETINFAEQKNDCQKMIYIPASLGAAIKERSDATNTKVNTIIKDALAFYIANDWGGEDISPVSVMDALERIRSNMRENHIAITDILADECKTKATG